MSEDKRWLGYCTACDQMYFLPPGPSGCPHGEPHDTEGDA